MKPELTLDALEDLDKLSCGALSGGKLGLFTSTKNAQDLVALECIQIFGDSVFVTDTGRLVLRAFRLARADAARKNRHG